MLGNGADAFVDHEHDRLADIGDVDVVFDVLGGEILDRSAQLVRPGGALVTIAEPPRVHPDGARASSGEVAFLTPFLSVGASWV